MLCTYEDINVFLTCVMDQQNRHFQLHSTSNIARTMVCGWKTARLFHSPAQQLYYLVSGDIGFDINGFSFDISTEVVTEYDSPRKGYTDC
jgi:hypothetical protein